MSAPELAVVMGVYNSADTLQAAIDSILLQEGVALEFIIVDDGSTDGSAAILDEAARKDSRLKVVHKQNEGLTRALIDGCALASAPWIARQDADDVSLPGRLQAQLDRAQKPDAPVLVACGVRYVSPDGEFLFDKKPPTDPEQAHRQILESGRALSVHGTMFFPRAAFHAVGGYRAEFYYAQDVDLAIRLAEYGPVTAVPDVFYQFRCSPTSISGHSERWQRAFYRLILRSQQARRLGRPEEPVLQQAQRLRRCCAERQPAPASQFATLHFLGACLLPRNPARACGYFAAALKVRPWSVRTWLRWLQARRILAGATRKVVNP